MAYFKILSQHLPIVTEQNLYKVGGAGVGT
jgi:hypothetical protein